MKTEAPSASGNARPPVMRTASAGGASVRASARIRPLVPVHLVDSAEPGFRVTDPYVRRFWVAALGSEAIAELLRMVRAAEKGESVRLPRHLPQLLRAGLATSSAGAIAVSPVVPPVPNELRWRFPPSLAGDHTRWLREAKIATTTRSARPL